MKENKSRLFSAISFQRLFFVSLVSLVSFVSCSKDEDLNTLPWAQVNFKIDVKNLDRELASAGTSNHKSFTQPRLAGESVGFGGLLVVPSSNPISGSSYYGLYAFDLSCPYERNANQRIVAQNDGTAKCEKCGSIFKIIDGSGKVQSGPAKKNLQIYPTTPTDTANGIFRVYR